MKKFRIELKEYQYKLVNEIIIIVNLCFLWIRFSEQGTYAFLYYLATFLLLSAINLLANKILGRIVIYSLLLFLFAYMIAQEVYYSAFNQYFLFRTAFGAKDELVGVQSSIMELIKPRTVITMLVFCINIIPVIFIKTVTTKIMKQKIVFALTGLICLFLTGFTCYMVEDAIQKEADATDIMQYYGTSKYFYYYVPNTNVVANRFGNFGLLYRDTIGRLYIHNETQYGIDDELIIKVLDQIAEDNNKVINEYTDIFKGKNLVVFQGESLMNLAINERLTPNLYRIRQEGISFSGFDAPLLYGSTSDTEFMAITSLLPVSTGAITFNDYFENYYPTTLGKMFTKEGYIASSFHTNYGNYYSREDMYPSLGIDFFDFIGLDVQHLELDSVATGQFSWAINWADHYFAYFIAYNGHQPYAIEACGNYPDSYYRRIREEYPDINDDLVCYIAKQMDFDKAIGYYINHTATLNEDTVILVFGDHIAKGIENNTAYFQGEESFKTPFIIWHKDVEAIEISTLSSTLDILPTIANMFGLDYDRRTVFGRDIMSENNHGFYFNNFGYYFTNDYGYDSDADNLVLFSDRLTEEEARIELNEYILRMNVSRTIVETDFFGRYPEYQETFGE